MRYEWQVRATVAGVGPVEADGGTWRTFTAALTAALTIGTHGTGSGSVTAASTAGGVTVSCSGAGCRTTGVFATTDLVQLTATPAAGATWVGWTGPGCADTEVQVTAAATCVAVFEAAASGGGGGSPGGDEPPAPTGPQPTGPVEYYHHDALGTVRAVTGESGDLIRRHDYLPFGEEWPTASGAASRRFTGKEYDTPTGLYYFGARYYRADIGRFTTVDPELRIQEALVDPQRWNRYAYVRNNPLKYVDPHGRWIETLWDIANVVMGAKSAYENFKAGRYAAAAVDVGGAVVDLAAVVAPGVPGGVGTAIKAARAVDKIDDAVDAARESRTVIGRVKDLQDLKPGERSLLGRLPDRGSPKANWHQNSGVLRGEMKRGLPIRDASPGDRGGQFLNAERNLLRDRG